MPLKQPDLKKPAFQAFPELANKIKNQTCPCCDNPIKEEDFKNDLSRREYSISGMCQKCQDEVFG